MSTEDVGVVAALAALPNITPRRLSLLLSFGSPDHVWLALRGDAECAGVHDVANHAGMESVWRDFCSDATAKRYAEACISHEIGVTHVHADDYPQRLAIDHQAPAVLFYKGRLSAINSSAKCAVVGTRSASPMGRIFAEHLGHDLAAQGVAVVSGLAKGIDAAAHSGVRHATDGAPPVAVVANGLDSVYPRHHTGLFRFVAEAGIVISESPPFTAPEPFRFPLRNRMIAALADVLVVVESRASGGSMHTVEAAIRRSVQVLAVPGAPGAPASIGTNRLIAEGCAPCVDATDVLVALGLSHSPTKLLSPESTGASGDLLQLLAQGPLTLDQIVSQSGLDLVTAVRHLGGLEVQGFVAHEGGWWQATAVITMGGTKM